MITNQPTNHEGTNMNIIEIAEETGAKETANTAKPPAALQARAERIAAQFRGAGHTVDIDHQDCSSEYGAAWFTSIIFDDKATRHILNSSSGHVLLSCGRSGRTRFDSILVMSFSGIQKSKKLADAEIKADVYAGLHRNECPYGLPFQADFR